MVRPDTPASPRPVAPETLTPPPPCLADEGSPTQPQLHARERRDIMEATTDIKAGGFKVRF